jgi:thiamine biosynthesis lipoprotein
MTDTFEVVRFGALGTTAELAVTDPAALEPARRVLVDELAVVDAACSRFRDDSDLVRVNEGAGRWIPVGPELIEALLVALRVARLTAGAVDPTVGRAMRRLGYDRDFSQVAPTGPAVTVTFSRIPGWQTVEVDPARSLVRVPRGVELDLGATAKAWCADRVAARAAVATGAGVLVALGGDVTVAGPPPAGGWPVAVGDDHRAPSVGPETVVAVHAGGLATSGTTVRRWSRGGDILHHVVDPATGHPAVTVWRTASAMASTCVDANAVATACLVLGGRAPTWLDELGVPARLVAVTGEVHTFGAWPA